MVSRFNFGGSGTFGDGYAMKQGYTLAWVGWEYDIPAANAGLHFMAPKFRADALPAPGLVRSEFVPAKTVTSMLIGIAMYVIYRSTQNKPLTKRFTIPPEALLEAAPVEYGSILVPVFGEVIDDEIVGTAGRLAAEHPDEAEGGAVERQRDVKQRIAQQGHTDGAANDQDSSGNHLSTQDT